MLVSPQANYKNKQRINSCKTKLSKPSYRAVKKYPSNYKLSKKASNILPEITNTSDCSKNRLAKFKPNATDFLTYLCYRRTHMLPQCINFNKVFMMTGDSTPSQQQNTTTTTTHKPELIETLINNDYDVGIILRKAFLEEDYGVRHETMEIDVKNKLKKKRGRKCNALTDVETNVRRKPKCKVEEIKSNKIKAGKNKRSNEHTVTRQLRKRGAKVNQQQIVIRSTQRKQPKGKKFNSVKPQKKDTTHCRTRYPRRMKNEIKNLRN